MGSLANLFNLNLTTDLPSIQKIGGQYLGKLEIPVHYGDREVSQTFNNILKTGTPYILMKINNGGWQIDQKWTDQGSYPIDVWVGQYHYTVGWWRIECKVTISGKNITIKIKTEDSSSANEPNTQKYHFPATSMEVAFIEMSEPV